MKKTLFLLALVVVLSGCATKITSNKSSEFSEKITRLYVKMDGNEGTKNFYSSFYKNLNLQLQAKGIASSEQAFDPLSLETEESINQKIAQFGPNLIMTINQTEYRRTTHNNFGPAFGGPGYYGGSSSSVGATFDIKLFQPNSKNPVWRASLNVDGQFGLGSTAKKAVERLIKKLIADNLI